MGIVYISVEDCIMCGACVVQCPSQAIYEEDIMMRVDQSKCWGPEGIFALCAMVCPVEAIIVVNG